MGFHLGRQDLPVKMPARNLTAEESLLCSHPFFPSGESEIDISGFFILFTYRDTINGSSTVLEHKKGRKEQERLDCRSYWLALYLLTSKLRGPSEILHFCKQK